MNWSSALLMFLSFLTTSCIPANSDVSLPPLDTSILREQSLFQIATTYLELFPDEVQETADKLRALVDTIDNAPTEEVITREYCGLCKVVAGKIKGIAQNDTQWEAGVQAVIDLCHSIVNRINSIPSVTVPIKGTPLCEGTINLQAPHIRAVFTNPMNVKAGDFCEFLNACIPPDNSSSTTSKNIERHSPNKFPTANNRKSSGEPGSTVSKSTAGLIKVVQLTDIHMEPEYAIGSVTDCGLPVCCTNKSAPGVGVANAYGEYTCNIPQRTVELFLSKVDDMNPDIVFFTGDVPPHTVWEETPESQMECTELLLESIKRNLSNHNVYPCLGNHETYPTNLYSHNFLNYTNPFAAAYADLWADVANFTREQKETIKQGGYYTILLRPGLRLLAINTVYVYTFNWYNVLNHKNVTKVLPPSIKPGEVDVMKTFIEETLKDAKDNNEKVILLAHHPLGGADYLVSMSRWYQSIVLQYSDIIVLQPTGHTHIDEFRLIYDSAGTPKSVVYVCPAVSAGGFKNPSMRIYYLNNLTFDVIDYEQYYIDLEPPATMKRRIKKSTPTDLIKLLYSAKSSYGMNDLSAQSWHELTERFEVDSNLLKTHLSHSDAEAKDGYTCLTMCQQRYVCRMRNADYDKYSECVPKLSEVLPTAWTPFPSQPLPPFPSTATTGYNRLPVRVLLSVIGCYLFGATRF